MLRLYITGFCMGVADLIPGVSGGTVAFISGIYETLLSSIKNVLSGDTPKLLIQFKIKEAIASIPFRFLLPLFAGIGTAILLFANLLSYLLEKYPTFVWAFFFGLVIASTWLVAKRVKSWSKNGMVMFGLFTLVGYWIVGLVPVETPENLPMFFGAGMIAIIAMILPGISGSFILLILGKYTQVLTAVKNLDIAVLLSVILGAVVGLGLFSRVFTWLFNKHHDVSIAALAGFMLGSVRKLWPWKEVILTRINSHGEVVPLIEENILPALLDGSVIGAMALMVVGVAIILFIDRLDLVKEE